MNPIQQQIVDRLSALPPDLAVIREHAQRYARYCSSIATDETLQIAHQPWEAPESYALRLYAPAKKAWFAGFTKRTGCQIPAAYRELLLSVNGCSVHDLDLFGLPPSLQARVPTLDRTRSQPLDLGAANLNWVHQYAKRDGEFHFGGRAWSDDENIGYFWGNHGLRALRASGEVVGVWSDLPSLLRDELPVAERLVTEQTPAEWWH
ncbi:MAG: SMI1/KNR4 family protein [Armatimonadota bacterium]